MSKVKTAIDPAMEIYRKPVAEQVLERFGVPWNLTIVGIPDIDMSDSSQARSQEHLVILERVREYIARTRSGSQAPPMILELYIDDNGNPRYRIIDGVHRYQMHLGLKSVTTAAYVVTAITPEQRLQVAIAANIHGLSLDETELKFAAVRLVRGGSTELEAASIVNLTPTQVKAAVEVDDFNVRAIRLGIPSTVLDHKYYQTGADTRKRALVKIELDSPFIEAVTLSEDAEFSGEEVKDLVKDIKSKGSEAEQLEFLANKREILEPRINFNANPLDRQAAENISNLARMSVQITKASARDYVPVTKTDADNTYIAVVIELRKFLSDILTAFDERP